MRNGSSIDKRPRHCLRLSSFLKVQRSFEIKYAPLSPSFLSKPSALPYNIGNTRHRHVDNRIHILKIAPHQVKGRLLGRRPADLLPRDIYILHHINWSIMKIPRPQALDETEMQARQRVRVGRQVALGSVVQTLSTSPRT